ncbi:MAG: NAD(P)/FAD-dependent oxidoreductase [Azospirillaceae bacterium]|nr:NAD(P)/FAD-dependent oxidoreductase [Azospirillaceae bacterium]
MTSPASPDVIVIGAGAAGLFTAIAAGKRGRRVVVVDHAPTAGAKILISGGGRCNFTNVDAQPSRYLSNNPHFSISALRRYGPRDFLALVERHGIAWHEKKLGQLFCDNSARDILAMLLNEAADSGVELRLDCAVRGVSAADGGFVVDTARGQMTAPRLVVATGGLSIPKMGATDFAYRLARQFGLAMVAPRPGLVPFTFTPQDLARTQGLSGVALDAVVRAGKAAFREALLITHRGLSGPSILQASSYWQPGQPITVDLTPDLDLAEHLKAAKRARPNAELKTILGDVLPRRFAERLCGEGGAGEVESRPLRDLSDKALAAVAETLRRWTVTPAGTEGYRTAEVTVGGIDTDELSSKTLEAKRVPGLHFVGEAVDVTGWLGGYNFQWAWSSGWVAGQAV